MHILALDGQLSLYRIVLLVLLACVTMARHHKNARGYGHKNERNTKVFLGPCCDLFQEAFGGGTWYRFRRLTFDATDLGYWETELPIALR